MKSYITLVKNTALIRSKYLTFKLLILSLLLSACYNEEALLIVKNSASDYEIIVASNASQSQYNSALVLQSYIDKISGVNINIVDESTQTSEKHKIYVGSSEVVSSNSAEISIKVVEKDLVISGGSDAAIQNAVYEFLESYLGCKWYSPEVEDIPSLKQIKIAAGLNYAYTPELTTRTVHSRLFYENPAFANKHKVTTLAFPNYVPNGRVHTFQRFMPEEKYFKEHPEYFALRDGKRLPTQLCLTNKDVYRIVRDSVASFFKQSPESSVISVSQNDNQQYCQDALCKKIDEEEGGPSGTMIRFVNKIAKEFPDKQISTLAYQYTRKPSKTIPEKNVLITLCSIECDRSAAITDNCPDFALDLKGWGALTDNIRIWDYTTQFTNFLAPFPNLHTLQPNLLLFRNNNAKWVFEQHSHNPSELFELRSYITAKLLWDPENSVEELITEFTNGYYKEAGIFIKQYIDLVHRKINEDEDFFLFLYGDPSQAFSSFLSPELLDNYNAFYDEAEKAVAGNPEVLQRVKEARLSVDYATLEMCKKNISAEYSLILEGDDHTFKANPSVVKRLQNFIAVCNSANITLMNEMGFKVDEYYDNYTKAMEVATQPNKAKGKKVTLFTTPKKYANEDPQTLTDGVLGGNSFYANWLGFEGNHMNAVIDLEAATSISSITTAFLQVSNHIVFFPKSVSYYYSEDNASFVKLGTILNDEPLAKTSKINDIKYFMLDFPEVEARYVKIVGENMNEPPYWHHAAGLPSWIFADEVIVD
jgi:hypothetical protein